VYFLAEYLLSCAKEAKPPPILHGDPYGMWIHGVAKSMRLAELAKVVEALKEINKSNA
jgi:hypothetical protein